VFVERVLKGARRIVGDDGERPLIGDGLAEMVCVIGRVGHDDLGRQTLDERASLWRVAHLAGRQGEAHGTSQATDRRTLDDIIVIARAA
jgi:hypothetical protein